jgi:hypothetical protein
MNNLTAKAALPVGKYGQIHGSAGRRVMIVRASLDGIALSQRSDMYIF